MGKWCPCSLSSPEISRGTLDHLFKNVEKLVELVPFFPNGLEESAKAASGNVLRVLNEGNPFDFSAEFDIASFGRGLTV
jgi:hypothetical protein